MLVTAAGSGGAVPFRKGREGAMPGQIPTGEIHHLRLTVTDLQRSREIRGRGGVATSR